MAAAMNEELFAQFLTQACATITPEEQAAVLAIVDQHGLIVHRANGSGNRLLHYASLGGHENLMRGLIDRGAVVDAKNIGGSDALMWVAINNQIPAAALLLDHGADLKARDNEHQTALMLAAWIDNLDCAVLLLSRGFDLFDVDINGKTALDLYGISTQLGVVGAQTVNVSPATLSAEVKEQRREVLRSAFAKGPLDPVVDADAEVPPPVVLNTPEKRRAHYMGQVLSNEGLLRLVVSFL